MTEFEFEWTDDGEAKIYWEGEHIGTTDTESPHDQLNSDGVPDNGKEIATDWIADHSVPDEQQLVEAIERLSAVLANRFSER